MPLSYSQLRTKMTEAQMLAFLLDTLTSLGFRTGSWHEGSVQRNIMTAFARNGADVANVVAEIVYNLIDAPNGDWLDLLGKTIYKLARDPGAKAVRTVLLSTPLSSPPIVIQNGDQVRAGTVLFSVSGLPTPVVLSPGSIDQPFEVTAQAVGVSGNTGVVPRIIGKGGTRAAWTGLPSVAGADRETDSRYLTRCELRFAEMTYSVGIRAYELWSLNAAASIKRVTAFYVSDDPAFPIHVALDPGTAGEIAAVNSYITTRTPPRDSVLVYAAVANVQPIKARPTVNQGVTIADVQALLQGALDAMPLGGWRVANAPAGRLLPERLTEALLCKGGAKAANIITPASYVILGADEYVSPSYDIEVST